jgi:plastocyanin
LLDLFQRTSIDNTTKKKNLKMHFTLASTLVAVAAATSASAANFQVTVGAQSVLSFVPNTVTAQPGDTVQFVFSPKNHTVTQSSFAAPCQPLANGADSGFQPVAANATQVPSFSITVNDTTPTWWYCRQAGHCEEGMVFAINPTANKTFAAFQAAANSSSSTGVPASSNSSSSSGSSGSGTTPLYPTGTGSSSTPSTSSTTSKSNGAIGTGARAGGLLAAVGLVAGILL